jgi:hypothetical protein
MPMDNIQHKTNLKFNLYIETKEVNKKEIIVVDFYVNIEEINELINYLRNNNIDPHGVKFSDINTDEETPIITQLYLTAFDIAFHKHLKDLMWTEEDFYDEVRYLEYTADLDSYYGKYDFNTDFCDSDEEYYRKIEMNEYVESLYYERHAESVKLFKSEIVANDKMELNSILCDLI